MSIRLPTFLTITGAAAAASFFMGKIASQKQIATCNARLADRDAQIADRDAQIADRDAQIKTLSQSIREEQGFMQRFIRIGSPPIKGAASIGKNLSNLKVCRFEDPENRMIEEYATGRYGSEQRAYDTGKRLGDCIDKFFKEIAQKGAVIAPAGIFEGGFPKEDTIYINYDPRAIYRNWDPAPIFKRDPEEMVQLSTTELLGNHSNTGNKPTNAGNKPKDEVDNSPYNDSHHSRSSDDDDDDDDSYPIASSYPPPLPIFFALPLPRTR